MWLHLFLRRAPRGGRPPAPPLSKLEKLEDSPSPHLSTSAESLRGRRGHVEMASAAETQTVAGRRRRRRRGWRLGGCLERKHTHGQMEAESHASVLASTDRPSDRPERARTGAKKRMHEDQPLGSRVIPGLPERESTMPAPTSRSPHAPGIITISSIFGGLFFFKLSASCARILPA